MMTLALESEPFNAPSTKNFQISKVLLGSLSAGLQALGVSSAMKLAKACTLIASCGLNSISKFTKFNRSFLPKTSGF